MIVYHHPTEFKFPSWLAGGRDVICRPAINNGGYFFGIGPHYLCGKSTESEPVDLGDGWTAWINGEIKPYMLQKQMKGQPLMPVEDSKDNVWYVPVILGPKGDRGFQVKYGPDFLPLLTEEQEIILTLAKEARVFLPRITEDTSCPTDEDMRIACTWAAKFLSYTNNINIECFGKLGLMDDALVIGTLMAVSCYSIRE